MKDAKSYVRDDGAGQTTITSLAYLLTSEGIDPLTAELLRRSLERYSDADFSAAFDGATKDKARQFLAAYNLCRMPFWGAQELAEAMAPCVDHTRALRVIELAQKAEELQAVFSPADGVKWAMGRGFLIGAHAKFLDIAGSYGNPHAPPSGNALAAEPQGAPAGAGEAGRNSEGWALKNPERFGGYRTALYQVLKRALGEGRVTPPRAHDVLEALKLKPHPDVQVMPDGLKYGNNKTADSRAIQKAINYLVEATPPRN